MWCSVTVNAFYRDWTVMRRKSNAKDGEHSNVLAGSLSLCVSPPPPSLSLCLCEWDLMLQILVSCVRQLNCSLSILFASLFPSSRYGFNGL